MKFPEDFVNKIICGDCLEIMKHMPDKCVDLVFTSPPYNLVKEGSAEYCNKATSNRQGQYDIWYDDEMPEGEYQKWQKSCIDEMVRICKGSVFYNHKVRYAYARRGTYYHPMHWVYGYEIRAEIIWDRCGAIPTKCPIFNNQDERIYQIGKAKQWNGGTYSTIWKIPPDKNPKGHPCSFPIKLPSIAINTTTAKDDIVFDPFMGSGTTAMAAKQLNRNYIGIEINPEYCEIAKKRLLNTQESLF